MDLLVYRLWYGRVRRVFRALLTRLMSQGSRIRFGPLKGNVVTSGEWACALGIFELHVQRAVVERLQRGDVFYDVGANQGFMTLLGARRVGPEGYVYAFEPLPDNVAKIGELMAANDIRNVHVVSAAVTESTGQAKLFATHSDKTPSVIRAARGGEGVDVSTVTLDEFAATHRPPTVVKIDVEGAEHLVFDGASQLLSGSHRVDWIVEIHDEQNEQSVTRSIQSNHYAVRTLPPLIARAETYPCHIVASRVEQPS